MSNQLLDRIRAGVIGDDAVLPGPFGPRRTIYADYTASGRALDFIEDAIRTQVLTCYANTHTEVSGTGLQTTRLREDARNLIRASVGGDESTAVIFTGSGSTAAIHKLISILNLRIPADLDRRYGLSDRIPAEERPVVFIGPFEHHSNEIPWRESIADVVVIPEDGEGHICIDNLRKELEAHAERPLKIGSFSAASNVTGILSDTDAIAALLHEHGALSFWDYAAAGPYVPIDMRPEDPMAHKDAIFLSPHKFVGGPGTPGVLVVRRELLRNSVPDVVGGGTVTFVNSTTHHFIEDPEHREEGGTPAIIESIRAGLVFALKDAVGSDVIAAQEKRFLDRAVAAWSAHPNISLLGNTESERLSIISFTIGRPNGRKLHHNAVVAMLNDVFGIQARGGCSCAGPYGHRLLGIDLERSGEFEREIATGCEGLKPGWVRVNFNYFISEAVFDYIVKAVLLIADHGWDLLPEYRMDLPTGRWMHRLGSGEPPMRLTGLRFDTEGDLVLGAPVQRAGEDILPGYLAAAEEIFASARERYRPDDGAACQHLTPSQESLRWFELARENHGEQD